MQSLNKIKTKAKTITETEKRRARTHFSIVLRYYTQNNCCLSATMTDKCYAVVVIAVAVAVAVNVVSVHDLHSVKISSVRLPRACASVYVCMCAPTHLDMSTQQAY